jgi:hypothetical protein
MGPKEEYQVDGEIFFARATLDIFRPDQPTWSFMVFDTEDLPLGFVMPETLEGKKWWYESWAHEELHVGPYSSKKEALEALVREHPREDG